jgi:hypothetical protein
MVGGSLETGSSKLCKERLTRVGGRNVSRGAIKRWGSETIKVKWVTSVGIDDVEYMIVFRGKCANSIFKRYPEKNWNESMENGEERWEKETWK